MGNETPDSTVLTAEQRREVLRQILERKAKQAPKYPLSLAQEALWFLDQLEPGRPTYSLYPAVRVRGNLNLKALEQAIGEIIRRHDTLRTSFPEVNGSPVQTIAPMQPYVLPIVDLSNLPAAEREERARRIAEDRPPIDLQKGPVFQPKVLRLGEADFVLMLQIHHIVFDGWSLGVLAREMATLYRAYSADQPSLLPELPIRYADFASWQRKRLQGETLDKLCDYWREQLRDLPPLELPTDHPRPAIRTSRGQMIPFTFSSELTRAVSEFSRREHVTTFMTLLAGFQELLHRYSGQEDFAVGTPIANRRQKKIEPLIGYFINMLVLRSDLSGELTFRELVQRVRRTALDAYKHQELTLDKVVEAAQPQRDMSRHPLFQVMFVLQNNRRPSINLQDLQVSPMNDLQRETTAKFELTVPLRMTPNGIEGKINFNSDLFSAETIQRMIEHYQMIMAEGLADPDRPLSAMSLLTKSERQRQLVDWNATELEFPETSGIVERFEAHAERTPDAEAVVTGTQRWTYGELNERANQLARQLRRRGVKPEAAVGVCLHRSPELFMTILAVLKAGGAYVPLDPTFSRDATQRLDLILQDAEVSLVVTQSSLAEIARGGDVANVESDDATQPPLFLLDVEAEAIASEISGNLEQEATGENLAYIIFTSGSTGRPKGVMVTRGNLLNAYHGWEQSYHLSRDVTTHMQMASFGFDVFSGDWMRAFCSGGKLVIAQKEVLLSAADLFELMRQERVDAAEFVPVVLRNLVEYLESVELSVDFMRLLVVGSDAWYVEDHRRAQQVLGPQTRLINSYGLTETTIDSSFFDGDISELPDSGMTPIGSPFANVRLYVLDAHLRPVAIGVTGELYIGGQGVARGYVNRPDLDAKRFLKDPFSASPEARMCRTGDRVRWRADGQIDFLGRADDQVKIRGFRIEPGEVEQVLLEHPLVAETVVLARERTPGDLHLVAYVTGSEGEPPTAPEARRFLAGRLPEYMIPSTFVRLDTMPTSSNGKIDRQSLPAPDWKRSALQGDYVEPRTPSEKELATVWSEVLNIDRVGAHDNFFNLGGNSLLALRLTSQVRTQFSVELPLVTLFAAPTLAEMSERITQLQAEGQTKTAPSIPIASADGPAPLSFDQERFWFVQQLAPESPILNMHAALPMTGELDVEAFRETIRDIVERHDALRTTFVMVEGERPMQVVAKQFDIDVPLEDLSHLTKQESDEQVRSLSQEQAAKPFDLSRGPLFRVRLLRVSDREHVLLVTTTHIVFDGWSLQVLAREVAEIYDARRAGRAPGIPRLTVQYADYATWQRQYLQGETLEALLDYWTNKLADLPTLQLPTDRPRRVGAEGGKRWYRFQIPASLAARLDRLCSSEGVTSYMLMLATFKTLLHRYAGANDIAVATPVANRRQREVQALIGLFVNTLVMRSDLSGDPTFRELLTRVRQTATEAYDHQELPFQSIVERLQPERDPTRHPLTQVLFNYHQRSAAGRVRRRRELVIGRQEAEREDVPGLFDLCLSLGESDHGLKAALQYDTRLYDEQTIAGMAGHFQRLLEEIAADPDRKLSQLELLTSREREQQLEWNQTEADFPDDIYVHELFEKQAAKTPDAIAAICRGRTISYRELNERANQLGHHLIKQGVQNDQLVAISVERSIETLIGLLGILKAGGAFLPLDPSLPAERRQFMLQDADSRIVVTQASLTADLESTAASSSLVRLDADWETIAEESDQNPASTPDARSLAYAIYTSGSTGRPKGVLIEHRSVVNVVTSFCKSYDLSPSDRVLQNTSISFDVAVNEIFPALSAGAAVVLPDKEEQLDLVGLTDFVRRHQVTIVAAAPTVLARLNEMPDPLPGVRLILSGGEALSFSDVDKLRQRAIVVNGYGPTEATICATCYELPKRLPDADAVLPIGRPLTNYKLAIVDGQLNGLPVGCPGELCIGGVGLARGYLNDPQLTSEKFVSLAAAAGERMYRTGDLARWLPDGNVEFLGRIDRQVKIRGFRIELGELEAALTSHAFVREAAVIDWQAGGGDKRLVAYVVATDAAKDASGERTHENEASFADDLRDYLAEKLPEYMVPSAFVVLDRLPLTSSDKVDRRALPLPDLSKAARRTEYVEPSTPLERQIATIWSDLLKVDEIGVNDDFFTLGGHSLLAVQVITRLRSELEVDVTLASLFAAPTVAGLAERIEVAGQGEQAEEVAALQNVVAATLMERDNQAGRSLVPLIPSGTNTPLFCIHGMGGHVMTFMPLANKLATKRPVYGLRGLGLEPGEQPHDSIEQMAANYLEEVRSVQPDGPYVLAGWSMGGLIAMEMARHLTEAGEHVRLVAMFDTHLSPSNRPLQEIDDGKVLQWIASRLGVSAEKINAQPTDLQWEFIAEEARVATGINADSIQRLAETCKAHLAANARYQSKPYGGTAVLFQAQRRRQRLEKNWQTACPRLRVEQIPGDHYGMLREPHVEVLARQLNLAMAQPAALFGGDDHRVGDGSYESLDT